jgi:hypothetical protein
MHRDFKSRWIVVSTVVLALIACGPHATNPPKSSSRLPAAEMDEDCTKATDLDVVVVLHSADPQDAGIPVLQLCPYNENNPVDYAKLDGDSNLDLDLSPKGHAWFHSVHFRLHKDVVHHGWKSDPNKTLWLAEKTMPLTEDSWPACIGSAKDVEFVDSGKKEIFFPLCENMDTWSYALKLDPTGGPSGAVAVSIDPQIINVPHSIETSSKP